MGGLPVHRSLPPDQQDRAGRGQDKLQQIASAGASVQEFGVIHQSPFDVRLHGLTSLGDVGDHRPDAGLLQTANWAWPILLQVSCETLFPPSTVTTT